MTASAAALITAVVACATLSSTYAIRGMIFTAPRSLEKNGVNKCYLDRYGFDEPGTCVITLLTTEENSTIITQQSFDVEEGETHKVILLKVPDTSEYSAKIFCNCTFETEEPYNFFEQDECNFHERQSVITFIQTDKPIYKPGQTMKFRVFMTDRYLKPFPNTKGDIWIEDPKRSRMAQWLNQSLWEGGIPQYEYPLADEPPLGFWKINVQVADNTESISFEVKEYVLPKFEVTVKLPPYVLVTDTSILLEICAKYTYQEPVVGILHLNCSLEPYSWSHEKLPLLEHESEIDGCKKFTLNVSLIDIEGKNSYRRIQIVAQVTEDGTGVSRNTTELIQRTYDVLNLEFVNDNSRQYFKPGIPYMGKLKCLNPDKTPAPGEVIQICATIQRQRVIEHWWATRKVQLCKNYTSNQRGVIIFQIPPQHQDTVGVNLEAKSMKYGNTPSEPGKPTLYQPRTSTSLQPYYSPSRSYIQVRYTDHTFECGAPRNIKVLYTAEEGETYDFHYEVISKGEVVKKDSKKVTFSSEDDLAHSMCNDSLSVNEVRTPLVPSAAQGGITTNEDVDCSTAPIGIIEVPIDIDSRMSPGFQCLFYYIRDDGEVVADSTKFKVEKCFQNKVEFKFNDEEKQPGDKTSYTLRASPNSVCGTKVLDKSVSLLNSNDPLTKEKVFEALQRFDQPQYYNRNHCNDKFRRGGKDKMASTGILPPRPWATSKYADALTAFEDVGWCVLCDFRVFLRPCSDGQNYEGFGGVALASVGVRGGAAAPAPRQKVMYSRPAAESADSSFDRSSDPNTATKSVVDVRSLFPETWLFDLVSVGEAGELIKKETLPHTITEWTGNAVCINDDDGLGVSDPAAKIKAFQAFFIDLTFPYSVIRGEGCPLFVRISNYLDKCLAIKRTINVMEISDNGTVTSEKSVSDDICVCGGKTDTYKFMYTPNTVGNMNMTVLAENAETAEACGDKETSGAVARDKMTKSLIVEAEGFPQEKDTSYLVCPEDYQDSTFNGEIELYLPNQYVQGSERAFCFFSGDIMGPAIDGMDNLVRLPTGCGEQNMVLFAPITCVLDYLTLIGKLTPQKKETAVKYMETGCQRQLMYKHLDGSYSAFGMTDKSGSTWLTAFVVKSFCEAKKHIHIDENEINKTVQWIVDKQQPDGCFSEVGKTLSEGMKGGVGSQGKNSAAPLLTAYCMTALFAADHGNKTVINNALTCIKKDTELNPYTASLYAYALAKAEDPEADRYLEYMDQTAIKTGDEKYWKNINGSNSLNLETAAYCTLAILKRKEDTEDKGKSLAFPIIRYMTKQRNSNGGFISTQDTVVGIQAISKFASLIFEEPCDLDIRVTGDGLDKTLTIQQEDKLVVKKFRAPVPSTLDLTVTGTGCVLIQASVRYNTLKMANQSYFSLTVNATMREDCKKANIDVCTSYLPDNEKSNMALIEMKMVSGFAADKDSLEELKRDPKVALKRYEVENNKVVLYFDEITNQAKCFTIVAEKVFPVEDSKPATAKVYDYYAKEREESTDYSIPESC